ncbi:hypothetical protein SAMN05421780_107124 [Flexibacter flexilis DSM 6793]|uniref:DUF3037 domain-containing protein n=1 Tax=Flexibacter flexilis DSM 6793 TaxID=927664 RepID=A0A1I1KLY8_9BACT|nr:hypothetical protein [Flexibacter flexilis]SFC61807.1 hypothetical protein SAMN05421780_107124 [Flexibacter flexilis DSM 6793]
MKAFFVPIYARIGTLSEEKLLIGFIVSADKKLWFRYSAHRLELQKKIMGNLAHKLYKSTLKDIELAIKKENEPNTALFKKKIFDADFFDYLRRYCQNIMAFGEMKSITIEQVTSEWVDRFFYPSLFGEIPTLPRQATDSDFRKNKKRIKQTFESPDLADKVDVDFTVPYQQLTGLYANTSVLLIAQNGRIFMADMVDFQAETEAVLRKINRLDNLIEALTQYGKELNLKKGKFCLLVNKPEAGSAQEHIFNTVVQKKLYTDISDQESVIADWQREIENNDYRKFSVQLAQEQD